MKPHEKTYQTHPLDYRVIVEPDPNEDGDGWLAVADLRVPVDECDGVGALFSAAPAMARALLRIMGACANTGSRTRDCFTESVGPCPSCDCKAALRKAGVLP